MERSKLLVPRFLLIANYPGNTIPIGSIIECGDEFKVEDLAKYPNLFTPLNWSYCRDLVDMPKRVKHIKTGEIRNVYRHFTYITIGDDGVENCHLASAVCSLEEVSNQERSYWRYDECLPVEE